MSSDLVRDYLREIGRIPLLTGDQEIELARQIQAWFQVAEPKKEELAAALDREPTMAELADALQLTEEELVKVHESAHRARRKMVRANLRLVVSVAKKYVKRGVDLLDLIQEGSEGLQRGAEKFDASRGYKFSTYAYWWIRQAITRSVAQQARTIRLPVHVTEKLNKVKKVQRVLAQQHGRAATTAEIAAELNMTPGALREMLQLAREPLRLEQRVGDEENSELGEFIEDGSETPTEAAMLDELRTNINLYLAHLSTSEREILTLRFGLDDGEARTLQQIGDVYNISRERVRQIEKKALEKLRKVVKRSTRLEELLPSEGVR